MKKKLVLVIAIVLVAVTACVVLAGCAPKNPSDFLEKWFDSNSKYMNMGNIEIGINGNIAYTKTKINDKDYYSYIEIDGDNVISYSGVVADNKIVWTKKTMTKAQAKEMLRLDKDIESINDIIKGQMEFSSEDFKDFDKNFTKKDGVYIANENTDLEGVTIKLSTKEMIMTFTEGELEVTYTLGIGYDKITIPKEAKDAAEM